MPNQSYFSKPILSAELCRRITALDPTAQIETDGDVIIHSASRAPNLTASSLVYFDGRDWTFGRVKIGAILTTNDAASLIEAHLKIVVNNPRQLFIRLMNDLLEDNHLDYMRTLDDVDAPCASGQSRIHETAIVMPGSRIGAGCVIEPASIIFPGVVLEEKVHVKASTLIGTSGAAIDVTDEWTLSQPHLGTVIIGAGTEIGSQTNIVRGIFGPTRVGRRCIIGNQVNIGHNVAVGDGVWVGAGAIVAGYTCVGSFTNIGMGALCKNGLKIGANCNVGAGSCLVKDMPEGMSCFGNPAKLTKFKLTAGPAKPFPTR